MTSELGHNLPSARDWLHEVLYSGQVTRVGQHLALVIFHIVDENGHATASVRDLERITGWGRQTIADHLGELKVFMSVSLGAGRAKSNFELQCKISRAVNELRCVRHLDANGSTPNAATVQHPDASVHQPDITTVREPDAGNVCVHTPDATTVRQPDATVVSTVVAVLPDAKSDPSRARIESSLREDSYTLEVVSEEKEVDLGAIAPSTHLETTTAFELWNDLALRVGLPLARTLTPQRRKSIAARMREHGGLDAWRTALGHIERSAFLQGENDRGWRADLDFLLQASRFTRVVEGGYGNGAHAKPKETNLERMKRLMGGNSTIEQGRLTHD